MDTAGLRKKARIEKALEKMSTAASIAALKECEVAILVVDALLGMDEQDLRLARLAEREGRAIVLAFNKWDAVEERVATRRKLDDVLMASLAQLRGSRWWRSRPRPGGGRQADAGGAAGLCAVDPPHPDRRAEPLVRTDDDQAIRRRWPKAAGSSCATRPCRRPGRRPSRIFGTRAEQLPEDYRRYLVNGFREAFDMPGVPVRLNLRGTSNPYAEAEG